MIETYFPVSLAFRVEESRDGLRDGGGDLGGRTGGEAVGSLGRDGCRVSMDGPGVEDLRDDLGRGRGGRGGR